MAVMTMIALNARAEAQRQTAEAQSLVAFMLTDLREKLQAVGRLDVMAAVNDRALRYYGRRDGSLRLPEGSPGTQAQLYQAIGSDSLTKDDLDGAIAAFGKARELAARHLALFPSDPPLLLAHAKSENGLGRVHELRDEWDAAERHYRAYAAAADPLAASSLGEAAAAAINLGNVAAGRKDFVAAEGHYRKAVYLLETATTLKAGDTHSLSILANAEAWLADTFYNRGLFASSLKERRRQHAIVSAIRTREPRSAEADFRYAAADRGLACSLWKTGDRAGAARYFSEAYKTAAALSRRDPRNAKWRELKQKLSDDLLHGRNELLAATTVTVELDHTAGGAHGCTR
jgi:tetratricopeptide (TPR) repeat protein